MNKTKIFQTLNKVIGKVNTSKLYSKFKYNSELKKYYKNEKSSCDGSFRLIYMVDGRVRHGGLSDRLRGLLTAYDYCMRSGREFKVNWTYPFRLEDYLKPNPAGPDWVIAPEEISYDTNDTDVRVLGGWLRLDDQPEIIDKVLYSKKSQIHYYSGNILDKVEKYNDWFHQLFVPDERVAEAVARCKASIGNKPYVSVTLRFQSLLGDFFEGDYPVLENQEEIDRIVDKCTRAVLKVREENPSKMVLVTSDSQKFLNHISQYDGVFIIPGELVHMDYTSDSTYTTYMKSFVDMLMLMDAERLYGYHTAPMFENSGFFLTCALLGGKQPIFLTDPL